MSRDGLIPSVGWSPDVQGVESGLDQIGRGNAEPIDSNKVVLTVDIPTSDAHIISGPGWAPRG